MFVSHFKPYLRDNQGKFFSVRSRTKKWKRKLAKGKCYYCDRAFPAKELTMDHIVPIARGGKSTKGNTVTACKECNNAKKQLFPMEWEDYLCQLQQE